jgi:hypothetical protein
MIRHRFWLPWAVLALLVGCDMPTVPTATPMTDGGTAAVPLVIASPTVAPAFAASDASYRDPLGRFTITLPKEWQPHTPTNPAGNLPISFDAPDAQASLTVTTDPVSIGTTAKEFAAGRGKTLAGTMTNYKKQGQESLVVGNVPAEALTYTGTVGTQEQFFRQILLVQGTDGWSLTFPLDPAARQRYGPTIDAITQSFAFGMPLSLPPAATPLPAGATAAASVIKMPVTAVEWKPDAPIAVGVPLRLPNVEIVVQLNAAAFSTKNGGEATLGTDEQFLIADMTIWNLGATPLTPLPEQFAIATDSGTLAHAVSADVAAEVAGGKLPLCGKVAVQANAGMRFAVVARVPKQVSLLYVTYVPDPAHPPQIAEFYMKP